MPPPVPKGRGPHSVAVANRRGADRRNSTRPLASRCSGESCTTPNTSAVAPAAATQPAQEFRDNRFDAYSAASASPRTSSHVPTVGASCRNGKQAKPTVQLTDSLRPEFVVTDVPHNARRMRSAIALPALASASHLTSRARPLPIERGGRSSGKCFAGEKSR